MSKLDASKCAILPFENIKNENFMGFNFVDNRIASKTISRYVSLGMYEDALYWSGNKSKLLSFCSNVFSKFRAAEGLSLAMYFKMLSKLER